MSSFRAARPESTDFFTLPEMVKYPIYTPNSFPVKKISRFCAPFQFLNKSTVKKQGYGTAK